MSNLWVRVSGPSSASSQWGSDAHGIESEEDVLIDEATGTLTVRAAAQPASPGRPYDGIPARRARAAKVTIYPRWGWDKVSIQAAVSR